MNLVFLTPSPEPAGGGSRFNAGLVPALRALGHTVGVQHGATDLPADARAIVDGLLLPDLEPQLEVLVAARAVAIVHHVSARAGQDRAARDAVHAIESRMLPAFPHVIATSAPVALRLAELYGIPGPPVLVPGAPDFPRSPGSGSDTCRILSAGVLTPRKGHDRLLQALARLLDLDWTLTIAGDARRDPVHAAGIAALIDTLHLEGRVRILADPDEAALEREWSRADLFAQTSSWEGYPAGIAEALRRGVPVVATAVGEIAAMVPTTAGAVCSLADAATLSKCLRRAIYDRALRADFAEGAWQAGLAMPGWPQQALAFIALIGS